MRLRFSEHTLVPTSTSPFFFVLIICSSLNRVNIIFYSFTLLQSIFPVRFLTVIFPLFLIRIIYFLFYSFHIAEKDSGFLRIGSLNVRVKKTTEAFSNFLGVGNGTGNTIQQHPHHPHGASTVNLPHQRHHRHHRYPHHHHAPGGMIRNQHHLHPMMMRKSATMTTKNPPSSSMNLPPPGSRASVPINTTKYE